ncbi:hypothetical protein D3C86_1611280 [compost metagenome]
MHLPKEDQISFEAKFNELKALVITGKVKNDHNWVSFVGGPQRRQYKVIAYPYKGIDKKTRNDVINQILENEMAEGIRGIVILGYNLDVISYPYTVVAGSMESDLFDNLDTLKAIDF